MLATFSSPYLTTVGSLVNDGTIATQYAGATLTVPAGPRCTTPGPSTVVHGNTLNIAGHVDNEASGAIDAASGTFPWPGVVAHQPRDHLDHPQRQFLAPEVDTAGATFDNAGGTITNDGAFQVINGTFIEGAGTEAGSPVRLGGNAVLDLRGQGASSFEFDGGRIEGNIAQRQTVTMLETVRRRPSSPTSAPSRAGRPTLCCRPGAPSPTRGP